MKILVLLFTSFMLLFCTRVDAQEVKKSADDTYVILQPDGTWKEFKGDISQLDPSLIEKIYAPSPSEIEKNSKEIAESEKEVKRLQLELISQRVAKADCSLKISALNAEAANHEILIAAIRDTLAQLQERETELQARLELASSRTALLERIQFLPADLRETKKSDWEKANLPGQKKQSDKNQSDRLAVVQKDSERMLFPPQEPCRFAYEGTDAGTGAKRKDTEPTILFRFTQQSLERHYGKRDFITCYGYITAITGGVKVLNLDIAIASPMAPQVYGFFPRGGLIKIAFLDGTEVVLFNSRQEVGQWNDKSQAYFYQPQFQIGLRDEKILREGLLDKILFSWGNAQEEYEIYEVDFFEKHLSCLEEN